MQQANNLLVALEMNAFQLGLLQIEIDFGMSHMTVSQRERYLRIGKERDTIIEQLNSIK